MGQPTWAEIGDSSSVHGANRCRLRDFRRFCSGPISMSEDFFSRDCFGDMLRINVMYIHIQRFFSEDTLRRFFQRYAPDQCDIYPCPEMFFRRYTLEIFLEICSRPM